MSVYVIGADRGFATFGYAVFELRKTDEVVAEIGVIETKKSAKKTGTLASSDHHRRTGELYEGLGDVFRRFNIMAAAAEATSLPRNASASYKVGRGDATFAAVLIVSAIPLSEASPQAIKKVLCGKATASKEDIQKELERRYSGQFEAFKLEYAKSKWEHGFDAAAAVVACLNSQVFLMARQLVQG